MSRLTNLQILRAVAAVIVVFSHVLIDVGSDRSWWPGRFGVEIFFVISGFIIAHTTHGKTGTAALSEFAWNRFWRIVPLYWACTTAYLVAGAVFPGALNEARFSLPHVVASYAFFPMAGPSGSTDPVYSLGWSLNYEVMFYVAFGLAMISRNGSKALVAAFVALVALNPLMPPGTPLAVWTAPCLLEFLVGVFLCHAWRSTSLRAPSWAFWPGVFVILGAAALGFQQPAWAAWWTIVPASAVVAIGVFCRPAFDPGGVGATIGDSSYSLYLLHMFVVRAIGIVADWFAPIALIFLMVSMSVLAGVVSYRMFEIPVLTLARQFWTDRRSFKSERAAA